MQQYDVKEVVRCITGGEQEFTLSYEFYNSLDLEVQKEIDRNYWRFGLPKGYSFSLMDEKAKKHFTENDVVIHHSLFELVGGAAHE